MPRVALPHCGTARPPCHAPYLTDTMRSGRACDLQRQRSKGERVVQRPAGQKRRPTSDQRTWHQHGQFANKTKRHTPTQQTKSLEPKWPRVTLREASPIGTGPSHPFLDAVTSDTLCSVAD